MLLTSQVRKAGERYVGEPVIRAKHSECLLREARLRLLGRPACLVLPLHPVGSHYVIYRDYGRVMVVADPDRTGVLGRWRSFRLPTCSGAAMCRVGSTACRGLADVPHGRPTGPRLPRPAPEAGGPGVLLLERDLPASRMQTEQLHGGGMPHMFPARRADNEEVAHHPGLRGVAYLHNATDLDVDDLFELATTEGTCCRGGPTRSSASRSSLS